MELVFLHLCKPLSMIQNKISLKSYFVKMIKPVLQLNPTCDTKSIITYLNELCTVDSCHKCRLFLHHLVSIKNLQTRFKIKKKL